MRDRASCIRDKLKFEPQSTSSRTNIQILRFEGFRIDQG